MPPFCQPYDAVPNVNLGTRERKREGVRERERGGG